MAETSLFDEWSSGVSLANSNNFFEEIPTELNNPANFTVAPEQLPANPTTPVEPVGIETDQPEIFSLDGGGTITVEKTSKGWKVVLDSGDSKIPEENFYGENLKKLILNLGKGKLEASRTIRKFKKEKLLGGDEPTPITPVAPRTVAKSNVLTADEVYEIKNKIADNPIEGFDVWIKKRFGLDPDEFAEALNSAPEAKRIVQAQKTKAEVEEVNAEFVNQNPDYLEYVNTEDDRINAANIRILVGRMAKAYLNKKITKTSQQSVVDDTIYELHTKGFWTVDNLENAKEELVENGLFERPVSTRPSKPQLQPAVAPSDPSVPAASRIANSTGQPVGLVGLPARSSSPAAVPEPKSLTDVDLQKLPLDQLKAIAQAQLRAMNK